MKNYSKIFIFMIMLYTACLLIANILAFKIVDILGLIVPAGTLVFPITYILGDVFSEIYGFKKTREIIIFGFICNTLLVIISFIAILMPYPDYFTYQNEFELVLSNTPRILLASSLAYLVGGISNSYTLNYIKYNTKLKALSIRLFLSTIIGELLDSLFFVTIAFIGKLNFSNIIIMIISQAFLKITFEFIMIPVVYKVINLVKRKEMIN